MKYESQKYSLETLRISGYSLIELLFVVVIMSGLTLIAIPQLQDIENKKEDLVQTQFMLEGLFYLQNNIENSILKSCTEFKEEQHVKMNEYKMTLNCYEQEGDIIVNSRLADNEIRTLSAQRGFSL